ncbi:hypothetical protein M0R45_014063 [Rubus argutus]|uniref:Uncharacterized protein n=1 Tax=Rubus argutus TaxID=59490 RepID=A0AAW1XKC3_RUBAR
MPEDLPGFYYDAEKNRYFPNKGPVPGSRRITTAAASSSSSSVLKNRTRCTSCSAFEPKFITFQVILPVLNLAFCCLHWVANSCRRTKVRTFKLLQARELYGNVIVSSKGRFNFKEEFRKAQATPSLVWKYQGTNKLGGRDGSLSIFEVGKVGQGFHYGMKCLPDLVWPLLNKSQVECRKVPGHIWRPAQNTPRMSSSISCIKSFGKQCTVNDGSSIQNALVCTLGAEDRGGTLTRLRLSTAVWTADCRSDGSRAVIGTNLGAALVDLETGVKSWLLRSKSDVLAQQLVHSGNVVLCGLRNGAVVTVDVREKREGFSARHARHRIRHSPLDNTLGNLVNNGSRYKVHC